MYTALWFVFSRVTMGEDFDIKMEQCVVIRFFVWKGKSPKETIDKLHNIYNEDELLPAPTIYWWHKVYQEGNLTVWNLEHITNISKLTIHCILTQNLWIWCVSSTWAPHFLTHEQMATCVEICEAWLETLQEQLDLFEKGIMYDESWVQ